jgi:hypothetical protein
MPFVMLDFKKLIVYSKAKSSCLESNARGTAFECEALNISLNQKYKQRIIREVLKHS